MTAEEIETKISELKEARRSALSDSLENPASKAIADKIRGEIIALETELEEESILQKIRADRAEAERQATTAKEAADRRQQAATIAASMAKSADRADVALNELMAALDEIQDAARRVYRLVPERQQSLSRILDPNKIGRAILGRRLADGRLFADCIGTKRPSGPRPDQTIRQFVESFS